MARGFFRTSYFYDKLSAHKWILPGDFTDLELLVYRYYTIHPLKDGPKSRFNHASLQLHSYNSSIS